LVNKEQINEQRVNLLVCLQSNVWHHILQDIERT
jgi:hypothetical protein